MSMAGDFVGLSDLSRRVGNLEDDRKLLIEALRTLSGISEILRNIERDLARGAGRMDEQDDAIDAVSDRVHIVESGLKALEGIELIVRSIEKKMPEWNLTSGWVLKSVIGLLAIFGVALVGLVMKLPTHL